MWHTVEQAVRDIAGQFAAAELHYGHGTDNPLDEAFYLVFGALGLDYDAGDVAAAQPLEPADVARLKGLAQRRIQDRVPVAYLVGEAWFAGLPFQLDPSVLIPRSPIAELIDARFEPLLAKSPETILDLCTGSGCIGIASALAFPEARVTLSDVSPSALAVAAANCQRHGVAERVSVIQADLLQGLARFDLIVSNPPYVAAADVAALPPEYHHEPELGLLSDQEGLEIPLRILAAAADHLTPGGLLIMEVGLSSDALQAALPTVPFLWLEFERGGEGVLAIDRDTLLSFRHLFN